MHELGARTSAPKTTGLGVHRGETQRSLPWLRERVHGESWSGTLPALLERGCWQVLRRLVFRTHVVASLSPGNAGVLQRHRCPSLTLSVGKKTRFPISASAAAAADAAATGTAPHAATAVTTDVAAAAAVAVAAADACCEPVARPLQKRRSPTSLIP